MGLWTKLRGIYHEFKDFFTKKCYRRDSFGIKFHEDEKYFRIFFVVQYTCEPLHPKKILQFFVETLNYSNVIS